MSKQGFPGPMPGALPTPGPQPWPATTHAPHRDGEDYPGCPQTTDKATMNLSRFGLPSAYPGAAEPGKPIEQAPPVPARSGLRRGR